MSPGRTTAAIALTPTASAFLRAGLFVFALTAPFSITAATWGLLLASAGAVLFWSRRSPAPYDESVGWAVLLYLGVKLLTGLLAVNMQSGIQEFFHFWPLLLFWVVPLSVHTGPRSDLLIRVLAVTAALVGLYAVWQNFYGYEFWQHRALPVIDGRYPAIGFFDNQQTWAGFTTLATLFLAGLAITYGRYRWLFAITALCTLAGGIASHIRGTLVGLLAGFAVLAVLNRKGRRWVLLALGVAVLAVALSPGMRFRFGNLWARALNPKVDVSRLYIWKTSWEIGLQRPLIGMGPGNFETEYARVKDWPEARVLTHAHNEWMHEWATSGLLGVVAFTWLIFVVARALWRRRGNPGSLAPAAMAAWVGMAGASVFQCHFTDEEVLMALVFVAALGLLPAAQRADT
jgi:O-antigen ligase